MRIKQEVDKVKARIPITNKQRRNMEIEARILCKAEIEKQRTDIVRRALKLVCYVLNDSFGFGIKRLGRLMNAVSEVSLEADTDPIFWEHIDRIVIDTLGIEFERDYTEDLRR